MFSAASGGSKLGSPVTSGVTLRQSCGYFVDCKGILTPILRTWVHKSTLLLQNRGHAEVLKKDPFFPPPPGLFSLQVVTHVMIIHLYIGWALAYGWMTRLILMRMGILGHFMPKIIIKACFSEFPSRKVIFRDRNTNVFKRMLLILEHVASEWLQGTPYCEWFWGKKHENEWFL